MKERAWEKEGFRIWRMKTTITGTWTTLITSETRNGGNGKTQENSNFGKTFRNWYKSAKDFVVERRGLDDKMRAGES